MKSADLNVDKRRLSYTRLIGEITHALNQALTEENAERKLTRAKMADILDVDRATITKLLSGTRNMRLETLADLAYALNRPVRVSLPSRTRASNAPAVGFSEEQQTLGASTELLRPSRQSRGASRKKAPKR